ncbi:hypothetical protein N8D56_06845 [Devosia sp. A8/3-2]|nr:hypothetical protein N8D56_06845 [Devosia sp. A8/3-2]
MTLSITLISTILPLICYFAYNIIVPRIERRRPSLSVIMNMQRRRWVANAAQLKPRSMPSCRAISCNRSAFWPRRRC